MPAWTERNWDHERDLRKHEPRPGEKGYVDHRLDAPIVGALEVAMIVKGLDDPTAGAALIQQYANTVAAEARLQAVVDTTNRCISAIDSHGVANEPA